MAIAGFFVQNTEISPQSSVYGTEKLTIDAVISQGDDVAVTITDHPIENGADVTDHIRDEPDKITIEGIVSRTPIELAPKLIEMDPSRHEAAWEMIYAWAKKHILVKVVTSARTYENMAIESASRVRSRDVGEALQFAMKLKQIIMVSSSEVAAPKRPVNVQKPEVSTKATAAPASPADGIAFHTGRSVVNLLR
jgi:hypothetical protein